jgi:hypothetical protein
MNESTLPLLCDPETHDSLQLNVGVLLNPKSGRRYPIRGGADHHGITGSGTVLRRVHTAVFCRQAPGHARGVRAGNYLASARKDLPVHGMTLAEHSSRSQPPGTSPWPRRQAAHARHRPIPEARARGTTPVTITHRNHCRRHNAQLHEATGPEHCSITHENPNSGSHLNPVPTLSQSRSRGAFLSA